MSSILDRLQPIALLILRCALGAIMVAHGYPKLFRGGMPADIQLVQSLGMPGWMAYLSACAECFGGLLLILGLITRIASVAVCINMLVAIFKVHLKNGFTGQGNYQFPLALAAMAFALIFFGAGPFAVDYFFGGKRR